MLPYAKVSFLWQERQELQKLQKLLIKFPFPPTKSSGL